MHRVLWALLIVACASPSSDPSTKPGGGKADGDSAPDAGVDAAPSVPLKGTCEVNTTNFQNGYGYRDTETAPIALDTTIDAIDGDGNVTGTVHVGSPWESIPDDLWRAWCHRAHQDGQPLSNSCAIGPFDIKTTALSFGDGAAGSFKTTPTGYAMSISAYEEFGRDSYYDGDYTKVSYYCSLQ